MGKIEKYWPKEEIIRCLKLLPQDKPINKKSIIEYHKQGILCHNTMISKKFGSIKNACDIAGIRCDCLYGKDLIKQMNKANTKFTKEDIIKGLKLIEEKYPNFHPMDLPKLLKEENLFCKDMIVKHFGSVRKALKELDIKYYNHYWNNKRILEQLYNLYLNNGPFLKVNLKRKEFRREHNICGAKLIRDRFGSIDKAAEYANIRFKTPDFNQKIGTNENDILDAIEAENNVRLERQYHVRRCFIDGYDPLNNIAYEVDEINHKYREVKDFIREKKIKSVLNCEFVRIRDGW